MSSFSGFYPDSFDQYKDLFSNILADQDNRVWNERDQTVLWFPRAFYCVERRMGPSGTKERQEVYCVNQLASWAEGFYIVNLFILYTLAAIWVIDFLFTYTYIVMFPLYNNSSKKPNCYTFQQLSLSKRLFALLLAQNLDPLFWEDVVQNILNTRRPMMISRANKKTNKPNKTNTYKSKKEFTVIEINEMPGNEVLHKKRNRI